MSKLIALILTIVSTVSAHAETPVVEPAPFVTKNLIEDIAKGVIAEHGEPSEVVTSFLSQSMSQVYSTVVLPAYLALMKNRSDGFLQHLSPELAEKYKTPEAQDALRKAYSPDSVEGYADALNVATLPVTTAADGTSVAQIVFFYVMTKPPADVLVYITKVNVPFVEGAKVAGGSVEALLETFEGLDLEKAKIESWETANALPAELRGEKDPVEAPPADSNKADSNQDTIHSEAEKPAEKKVSPPRSKRKAWANYDGSVI